MNKIDLEEPSYTSGKLENLAIKKNVLVVDDETLNIALLKQILKGYDFNILTANNGKEALITYFNHHIDLILLNLYMPIMNGFDVANEIRKKDLTTPIVAISAALINVEHLKKNFGIDYFLPKPVNINILKELIDSILLVKQK